MDRCRLTVLYRRWKNNIITLFWRLKRSRLTTELDRFVSYLGIVSFGEGYVCLGIQWYRHQMETGHRWIPLTKASDAELWYFFFDARLNKPLSKPSRCRWFETPGRLLWRHCNEGEAHPIMVLTGTVVTIMFVHGLFARGSPYSAAVVVTIVIYWKGKVLRPRTGSNFTKFHFW